MPIRGAIQGNIEEFLLSYNAGPGALWRVIPNAVRPARRSISRAGLRAKTEFSFFALFVALLLLLSPVCYPQWESPLSLYMGEIRGFLEFM